MKEGRAGRRPAARARRVGACYAAGSPCLPSPPEPVPPCPIARPRRLVFALLSVVLGALAAAGLVELGARLLTAPPRTHATRALQLDPELGFRGIPGHRQLGTDALGPYELVLNDSGHRGPDLPAPPGRGSIVLLGDSFFVAEALRWESTVAAQLAERRRARGDLRTVFDLATIDHGSGQARATLQRHAAEARPEVVVLGLYPPNDLANDTLALAGTTAVSGGDFVRPYWPPRDGRPVPAPRRVSPWRARLRNASRAFAQLELGAMAWGSRRGIATLEPFPPRPSRSTLLRTGHAPRPSWELFRAHDPRHPWSEAWRTTTALLRALRDETRALGARLVVVVIPSEEQVLRTPRVVAEAIATLQATGRPLDSLLDWNRPERRLARFFRAEGIEAIWLLPWLRTRAARGDAVYTRDAHLGAAAHAELARRLDRWIEGGPPAALAAAELGEPVDRLQALGTSRPAFDFRTDCALDAIGKGFLDWSGPKGEAPRGWRLGTRGLLVLERPRAAGARPFHVRGVWQVDAPSAPETLVIQWTDGRSLVHPLPGPGPFALEVPVRAPATADRGRSALTIGRQRLEGALILQSIGFGEPAPARGVPCPDATRP